MIKTITLKDKSYCCGCCFLEYDEEKSTPSGWLGEGYYVHRCLLYIESLIHYLHYPIRIEKCKSENLVESILHEDTAAWRCGDE